MKRLLLLLVLLSVLCSCEEKSLEAGIETTVFGRIYDTINEIPIKNIKIKIGESIRQGTFSGTNYNFKGYLDSTITDSEGNYKITFETSGKGTIYDLHISLKEDISFNSIREVIKDENIGATEELNLDALQLYPVNLKITTTDVFEESILIFTQFSGGDIEKHPSLKTTTERTVWLDKNQSSSVSFHIEDSNPLRYAAKTISATNSKTITTADIALSYEDFN
ncbi:MAG: hypothetical protein ABJO28_05900 [Maribacter dokdonensis]|uniref:hypothetical protein n=1 Tax=Maribacter dokdonensis TaxID=320912 RepID=UPI00326508BF